MPDSLREKTLKGVGWSFLDNILGSGITFIVGIVLARILSPSEFGIIGMLTIFIAVSNSIVDSGFSNALIRKVDANELDYNTVFIFNLVVSTFLYVLLFFLAPFISSFYDEPQLNLITRVIGLILLLNAFGIIQRTLLVKHIDFKIQAKVSAIASIGSGFAGICLAIYGFGVWSLVVQQLSRQLLNTLFLWLYSSWRPQLMFSKKSFSQMFSFGSKLMLSGVINTVFQNIYYLVIGKIYTAQDLGYYTRAEQFKTIFSSNLTAVVQRVSYPVLSSIQNDEERLLFAYKKMIKTSMLISFALMLGMAAIAKPLVYILIGPKWLPSVSYLQIMCFSGMLYPLHAINLNILQVKGRSDLFLRLEIMKKSMTIFPITLGLFLGIEFLLLGSVFVSLISFFINAKYSEPLIGYSFLDQIKDILPSLFISLFTALVMWMVTLFEFSQFLIILVQVVLGGGMAIFLYELNQHSEYNDLKKIVINNINRFLWTKR
ncbi:Polysaccharide biosynthesis protein [anaerobic digester metagenome]